MKYPFLFLLAAIACSSPTGAGSDGFAEEPTGTILFTWAPRGESGGAYRVRPDGSDFGPIPVLSPGARGIEMSRDGTRLIFQGGWGDLFVWRFSTTSYTQITSDHGHFGPTWSPDGNRVASVRYDDVGSELLRVIEADGSGTRDVTALMPGVLGGFLTEPVFFPRGDSILYVRYTPETAYRLWLAYTDGRVEREFTSPFGQKVVIFGLSRDGNRFAAAGIGDRGDPLYDGTIVRVALGWNGPFVSADFSPARVNRLSFSPDGKFLVVTLIDVGGWARLEVLELSTLRRRRITPTGNQGNAQDAKWGI